MNKWLLFYGFLVSLLTIIMSGCNLEKEVEITLPDYESQLVLECYLEPGKPYNALLTRSDSYFAAVATSGADLLNYYQGLLVQDAQVEISVNGKKTILENNLLFDPASFRFSNYSASESVPFDYENTFELRVITADGRTIVANTSILKPVSLDSVVYEFGETSPDSARVLTYFSDNSDEKNYYRRMIHRNTLDSIPDQDFVADDRFVDGQVVFGTGYDYGKGEKVINTLYHIDKAYYDFINSVANAIVSNGNPFAQPGEIQSNLGGDAEAIGVFTGLSYVRDTLLIK
jgi:hypothetical protein